MHACKANNLLIESLCINDQPCWTCWWSMDRTACTACSACSTVVNVKSASVSTKHARIEARRCKRLETPERSARSKERGQGERCAQAIMPEDQLQIAVLHRRAGVFGRRQCTDGLRSGLLDERERQCRD